MLLHPEPTTAEKEAWQALQAFSTELVEMNLADLIAVISIGSLPGGYYRPGASDLDVVALFAGGPPSAELAKAITTQLELAASTFVEKTRGATIECLPRWEVDLMRGADGQLPKPDLNARLNLQSSLLWGNFPLGKVEMPGPADFLWESKHFQAYWHEKNGPDAFACASEKALVNYAIGLMRLYLAFRRNVVIYDKSQIMRVFGDNAPEVPIPHGITACVPDVLVGRRADPEALAILRQELPAFEASIISKQ